MDEIVTPIGTLVLVAEPESEALAVLDWQEFGGRYRPLLEDRYGTVVFERSALAGIVRRVRDYFDGAITALDDIPVSPGGTPFQQRVWAALRHVPAGRTTSYGALAAAIGCPGGARAVGVANATNPVAIVVPCHRVIGANGALTGYGGGLDRKRWLLAHEARACGTPPPAASEGFLFPQDVLVRS
jgi:methylated-DNA-[protein]-cysteine S-methyltransferase